MKIALAILGIFLGYGLVGLAVHDHVSQAWDVLSGQALPGSKNTSPKPPTPKPARHGVFGGLSGIF